MSITHTYSSTWSNGSRSIQSSIDVVGNSENNFDAVVPDATTNQSQAFAMTTAAMLGMLLKSNVDCTIKTNSTGSPANTFNLKAGIPYIWHSGLYYANPVTTNITVLYITNASGQQARVQGRFLSS